MHKSYNTDSCKRAFKPLQELNLIDSFLFGASTEKTKESFDDGVALGREEARKEGILALISSLKDLNIPSEQILEQLMQKFALTMEDAKTYLNEN